MATEYSVVFDNKNNLKIFQQTWNEMFGEVYGTFEEDLNNEEADLTLTTNTTLNLNDIIDGLVLQIHEQNPS